jgi:hypothetical protein
MARQPQQPPQIPTIDPDNISEIICDGRFNVHPNGPLATMTFTHARPDAADLIDRSLVSPKFVVRARIVVTMDNLVAMRDLLNRIIQENPPAGTKPH